MKKLFKPLHVTVKSQKVEKHECYKCGTVHDDEGYGYHDDGKECSESYPLGGSIEPYDIYVENELTK